MTDPCNLPDAKEPPHCPSCSCAQGSWGDQVSSERLDELSSIRLLDVLDLRDHAARLEIQASLRELKALREQCKRQKQLIRCAVEWMPMLPIEASLLDEMHKIASS